MARQEESIGGTMTGNADACHIGRKARVATLVCRELKYIQGGGSGGGRGREGDGERAGWVGREGGRVGEEGEGKGEEGGRRK